MKIVNYKVFIHIKIWFLKRWKHLQFIISIILKLIFLYNNLNIILILKSIYSFTMIKLIIKISTNISASSCGYTNCIFNYIKLKIINIF